MRIHGQNRVITIDTGQLMGDTFFIPGFMRAAGWNNDHASLIHASQNDLAQWETQNIPDTMRKKRHDFFI